MRQNRLGLEPRLAPSSLVAVWLGAGIATIGALGALGAIGGIGAPALALTTIQDQSDVDLTSAFGISTSLAADDLHFPVTSRLDTVTVWLSDIVANDNGQLDGFSGTLSRAIFSGNWGQSPISLSRASSVVCGN